LLYDCDEFRDELIKGNALFLRKLHNVELRDLYSSPGIIRIIKLKVMKLAGHVAQMGGRGMCIVLYRYALHNDIGKVCCMGMHYIMILIMLKEMSIV
jgi:hypothetical protein